MALTDVLDVVLATTSLDPYSMACLGAASREIKAYVDREWGVPRALPVRVLSRSALPRVTCHVCDKKKTSCIKVPGLFHAYRCHGCAHNYSTCWEERVVGHAAAKQRYYLTDADLRGHGIRGSAIRLYALQDVVSLAFRKYNGPTGLQHQRRIRETRNHAIRAARQATWSREVQDTGLATLATTHGFGSTCNYYRDWFVATGRFDVLASLRRWLGRLQVLVDTLATCPQSHNMLPLVPKSIMVKAYVFDHGVYGIHEVLDHLAAMHWLWSATSFQAHRQALVTSGYCNRRAAAIARNLALQQAVEDKVPDAHLYVAHFSMVPPHVT